MNPMKNILTITGIMLLSCNAYTQIQNSSFETSTGDPNLGHWIYLCVFGSYSADVPPGGGNWSLEKEAGNMQGCWPGDVYQVLPSVQSGTVLLLKAWAKSDPVVGQTIGIYIGKKGSTMFPDKIAGDTTSSKTWTLLSVQDTFSFSTGEQAAVILDPGLTSGPGNARAYFDLVSLEPPVSTAISEWHHSTNPLQVYVSPHHEVTFMEWPTTEAGNNFICIFSADGRLIQQHTVSVLPQSAFSFSINSSQFASGVYFVQIIMPDKTLKKSFIIR
jgi:hypothetical protein